VRAAIDERLTRLRSELATRAIGPKLAGLRDEFERIAAEEVARALSHELRTLNDRQRGQLERLARTLAHRLAHLPLAGLRAAALHASADAVEAFFAAAQAARVSAPGSAEGAAAADKLSQPRTKRPS
jgi:glutamyl-tRNA reductase